MSEAPELAPLNVWSRSQEEIGRLLSNFAHTPFAMDGTEYASVEAFYACLFIEDEARHQRVRQMYGVRARHEIPKVKPRVLFYRGEPIALGSPAHHALIERAIRAKLAAHPAIAAAFVATRPRPIEHETGYPDPPDTEFPKEALCYILAKIREQSAQPDARQVDS